jgi:cellulose biosynthesis protein BcsQ
MIHNAFISTGELIDKITILKIKCSVINNKNNINQLESFLIVYNQMPENLRIKIIEFEEELFHINKVIWKYENIVRSKVNDEEILKSSKTIFEYNDKRNKLKKLIDEETISGIFDEKKHEIN